METLMLNKMDTEGKRDVSLTKFETFDDLLSQNTLHSSQYPITSPVPSTSCQPGNMSFEKFLYCLSKDILSSQLFPDESLKDDQEVSSASKKSISQTVQAEGNFLQNQSSDFSPVFRTAGRRTIVCPNQKALQLASSLLEDDIGDDSFRNFNGLQESSLKCHKRSLRVPSCLESNIISSLQSDLKKQRVSHEEEFQSNVNLVKIKLSDPLAKQNYVNWTEHLMIPVDQKQKSLELKHCKSSDFSSRPRNRIAVASDLSIHDALCQSPPWTRFYLLQSPKLSKKSSVCHNQHQTTEKNSLYQKNEAVLENMVKTKKPPSYWKHSMLAENFKASLDIEELTVDSKRQRVAMDPTHDSEIQHSLLNGKVYQLNELWRHESFICEMIKKFDEQNNFTCAHEHLEQSKLDTASLTTILQNLTNFNLVAFLIHDTQSWLSGRKPTYHKAFRSAKALEMLGNFSFLTIGLKQLLGFLDAYFPPFLKGSIRTQYILSSVFEVYSYFAKVPWKIQKKRFLKNILYRVYLENCCKVLSNGTSIEKSWKYPSALLCLKRLAVCSGITLTRPLQLLILHNAGFGTFQEISAKNTTMVSQSRKKTTKEPWEKVSEDCTTSLSRMAHWFIVTDGKTLGYAGFQHRLPPTFLFGSLIRIFSYKVFPCSSLSYVENGLPHDLLACALLSCFPNVYLYRVSDFPALPHLGFLNKLSPLSFSRIMKKIPTGFYLPYIQGIIIRKFPLCLRIDWSEAHETPHLIQNLSLDFSISSLCYEANVKGHQLAFESCVLILDATALKDLPQILLDVIESSSKESQWNSLMDKLSSLCTYIHLKHISPEDYCKLQVGENIYCFSTLLKLNSLKNDTNSSNTSLIPCRFQTTSRSDIVILPTENQSSKDFSKLREFVLSQSSALSNNAETSTLKVQIVKNSLFPLISWPTLVNIPYYLESFSFSLADMKTKTMRFGLLRGWYYDLVGIVLTCILSESPKSLTIYLVAHSGIAKCIIQESDTSRNLINLKTLGEKLKTWIKEEQNITIQHVQFDDVQDISHSVDLHHKSHFPHMSCSNNIRSHDHGTRISELFIFHGNLTQIELLEKRIMNIPKLKLSEIEKEQLTFFVNSVP